MYTASRFFAFLKALRYSYEKKSIYKEEKSMKETVSDYAAVVSGRFYNEIQLKRLAELISEANCLSPEIGFAMAETLSSPVLHRCEND